jgi:hypothetical protein
MTLRPQSPRHETGPKPAVRRADVPLQVPARASDALRAHGPVVRLSPADDDVRERGGQRGQREDPRGSAPVSTRTLRRTGAQRTALPL